MFIDTEVINRIKEITQERMRETDDGYQPKYVWYKIGRADAAEEILELINKERRYIMNYILALSFMLMKLAGILGFVFLIWKGHPVAGFILLILVISQGYTFRVIEKGESHDEQKDTIE